MKKSFSLFALSLLLLARSAWAAPNLTVVFVDPENYSDASYSSSFANAQDRDGRFPVGVDDRGHVLRKVFITFAVDDKDIFVCVGGYLLDQSQEQGGLAAADGSHYQHVLGEGGGGDAYYLMSINDAAFGQEI